MGFENHCRSRDELYDIRFSGVMHLFQFPEVHFVGLGIFLKKRPGLSILISVIFP